MPDTLLRAIQDVTFVCLTQMYEVLCPKLKLMRFK